MDFVGKNSIIQNIGEYNDGEVQVGDEGAGRGRTRKRVENSGSFATPSVAVAECPRDLREENLQSSALRSTVAKASQLFKA